MLEYTLSYGGVPFVGDVAKTFRMFDLDKDMDEVLPLARKQQPNPDLLDELNRLISFRYQQDFDYPDTIGSRTLNQLAQRIPFTPTVNVGEWYYPPTARCWSVFRGLATSSQVKQMTEKASNGSITPQEFIMQANPVLPTGDNAANYKITTNMYMLPARPLADHGQGFDGLYLVTLVDERFHWRYNPVSLRVASETTWASLLSDLSTALSITLTTGTIDSVYGKPEPDSHLWTSFESAAVLLDAVAYNIGKTVCRLLDGTYVLRTTSESKTQAVTNRQSIRMAGGDFFNTNETLNVGKLTKAKNFAVPKTISVSFPKYVGGETPHFYNTRQDATRWIEDSYGEAYVVNVPIASGGVAVSGLTGILKHSIRENAKAVYNAESDANPNNASGLTALAMKVAQDHWSDRALYSLDEVYPGTFKLVPEGIHDIVWTYSERMRLASTRVVRSYWNQATDELQHAGTAASGSNHIPAGMGGQSVSQTIRESQSVYSGQITTTLASEMASGASTASLTANSYFPTQNRWRGKIENEIIVFEGTSGGTTVGVVKRAADGTLASLHAGGTTVTQLPGVSYGVNLTNYEKGMYVHPAEMTSGGLFGVSIVPQTQSVKVLSSGTTVINGITCYSGQLQVLDSTKSGIDNVWVSKENVWIADRNSLILRSGARYDGQFGGYTKDNVAPLYTVNEQSGGGSAPSSISGSLQVRNVDDSVISSGVTDISFDQDDALIVSQPGAGQARIDLRTWASITANSSGVQFVNDTISPGDNYYYGTRSGGTKGYQPVTSGNETVSYITDGSDYLATDITTNIAGNITAGSTSVIVTHIDAFPTQNRWKGFVDTESILFEGTSGSTTLAVVQRGMDGTTAAIHSGAVISLLAPQDVQAFNRIRFEKGQFAFPQEMSGGLQGINIVPQTQSIRVESSGSVSVGGIPFYSGLLQLFNPGTGAWEDQETVWVTDRNGLGLASGRRYDGQFFGHTSGLSTISPLYCVNEYISGGGNQSSDFNLTVQEADGTPIYSGIQDITFDQDDGFALSQLSANKVQIDLRTWGSVTANASGVQFVNDQNAPQGNYYYGTNSSGTKGYHALTAASVNTQMSITSDSSGIKLVSDELTPNANYYYGTDSGGTRGWQPILAAGNKIAVQMSITQDQSGIKLVNDQNAPQGNYFYGTNSGGTKGWHPIITVGNVIATQMSITQDQSGIKLVNDVNAPGDNYYYGTRSGGVKTYQPVTSGNETVNKITDGTAFLDTLITTNLAANITAADTSFAVSAIDCFPTQNRWKGLVGTESILFEGTSGSTTLAVVQRGVDGTTAAIHSGGDDITVISPQVMDAVNRITFEKGQFAYPQEFSGGFHGTHVIPQLQNVQVLTIGKILVNGFNLYSGLLRLGNTTASGWTDQENVWIADRNNVLLYSGKMYAGHFVGHSASISGSPIAPVYYVSETSGTATAIPSGSTLLNLSVKEADGNPIYSGINDIAFDQDDGFVVSQPGAKQAQIDLRTWGSVTANASGVQFVNDQNTPQGNYYYGTDSGGTRGWQPLLAAGNSIATQMSITQDQSGIKFVNDQASPGPGYYYGTNSGSTKGYYPLIAPVASGGFFPLYTINVVTNVCLLSGNNLYVQKTPISVPGAYISATDCDVNPTDCCVTGYWCISPAVGDDYCFEGTEVEADAEATSVSGTYSAPIVNGIPVPYSSLAECNTNCGPGPGDTCATAWSISDTTVYGPFIVPGGGEHWFTVAHAGGDFHVDIVITDNAGITSISDVYDDCEGSALATQPLVGTGTFCYGTSTASTPLMIRISPVGDDPITYTLAFNAGTC